MQQVKWPDSNHCWLALAILTVFAHLGLIFYGLVPNLISRPMHFALLLPWIFIAGSNRQSFFIRSINMLLTVIGVSACLWIALNQKSLKNQYGFLESDFQFIIAVILIALTLEAARRSIGWPLPVIATTALCYALYGQHIPGEFGHSGTPLASFLGTMTIAEGGLWGSLTGVSVSVVAVFVILGAVLNAGEAGRGFINAASIAAGRLKAGAAKVSVLSSALFGSISGSASANVASTGAVTLPTMTRLGYPPRLAAAVEAVASSGGQIMPPLMGAGAFVMVELTGIPYSEIIIAASLPAVLYFFAVWIGIDAYASRYELAGLPADQQPTRREALITAGFFVVPFSILLIGMFAFGFTPQFAACMAIVVAMLALFFDGNEGFKSRQGWERFCTAMLNAAQQIAMIGSIIVCASIIIGVLSVTGLGVKLTSSILSFSGGQLWPSLLLTALACLLLGMEVPTTAAYVICVSVAGPALIGLGLEPLQAHLFVFWFALLSTITPPVCGAVFIAAGMVRENWLKVAGTSMALGIGLYLIPLAMIVRPELIRLAAEPGSALLGFMIVAVGLGCISFGLIGRTAAWARAGLLVLGLFAVFGTT